MHGTASLNPDAARRVAQAAAAIDGVRAVTVCTTEGLPLASAGTADAARDAALASFLALRAEALPVDGDLRGMGRQVAGSTFNHLAITGSRTDSLLVAFAGAYLLLAHTPGRAQSVLSGLAPLARRYAATPPRSPAP